MKLCKAVIPAAGLGTRFLPATKAQPKEMLPIVDTPTLQYIVEEAVASGIEDILIVTGHNKKSIEDHFDRSVELEVQLEKQGKAEMLEMVRRISDLANIYYIRQKEPKGLGHAIGCARSFVGNEPFAVLLGDDIVHAEKPCLAQMAEQFEALQSSILGVQRVATENVSKYGIIAGTSCGERLYEVETMVEKPALADAPSDIAVLGRYIITPRIFEILANTPPGAGGEIQLTDALRILAREEKVYAYDFIGHRYDVGEKQGFLAANIEYALRRPELKAGFVAYLQDVLARVDEF